MIYVVLEPNAKVISGILGGGDGGHDTAIWGGITGTLSNQTDLDTRLKVTEEQYVYFEIFDSKTTSTGTVSVPSQSTILFDRYANGIDALCVILDSNGRPLDESARETDGTIVTVSTFDASGNYTLSGTPSPVPFGIVYQIKIQLQYSNNVPESSVIVAWQYEGVEVENNTGYSYLNGNGSIEGSRRFEIDSNTGYATIKKLISGIWQPATLQTGPNSLFVGLRVGVAAAGHHIVTEDSDGHFHFHGHSKWDGELSTSTARILYAYNYEERRVLQPDNTGTFLGTSYEFAFPASRHDIIGKAYLQTDTTISTTPVRMQVWEFHGGDLTSGTLEIGKKYRITNYIAGDDFTNIGAASNATGVMFTATGTTPTTWTNSSTLNEIVLIFDQYYPASAFTASSEQSIITNGFLEFATGNNYYFKISSDNTFSFKTNAAGTFPWFAVDVSDVHEDDMLQTTEWVSGDTFTVGQKSIQNRTIYRCNTAGVQTGTFTSNIALWDDIFEEYSPYWKRTGTVLSPKNYGDDVLIENVGASLLTVKSTGVGSVYAKVLIESVTNSSLGIVGVSDAKGYFTRGGQYWEHGMPWNTGTPDYDLDYVIRKTSNTTPDFGIDKDDGRVYTPNAVNIGSGTITEQKVLIEEDQDASTILRVANLNAGTSARSIVQIKSQTAGLNLTTYSDLHSTNPDMVLIGAFSNAGGLDIKTDGDMRFSLSGTLKWKMTGSTLESLNTGSSLFIGEDAGINDDLSDNKNTFIGASAGKANTSGFFNTSLGFGALQANTTGGSNIAMGTVALGSNVTGSTNVAIGNNAIGSNNSGGSNVAVGNAALLSTTGSFNVGVGTSALRNNTSGASNVAVGHDAGYALGAGSSNVVVGRGALGSNSSGSNNISIGYQTGINNLVGSGNVFIGYQAGANETGSNKLYITNTYTSTPLIYGEFDTGYLKVNGLIGQDAYGDNSHLVMDFNFSEYGSAQHQYDYASGTITTTVASTPLTSTTYGKFGSGVLLGASQGWSYEPPTNYPTGAAVRTIECWVKPSTVAAGVKCIFLYGGSIGSSYASFGISLVGAQAQMLFSSAQSWESGTTDFVVGEWHLVHMTYDGSIAKMYVNNVLKVTSTPFTTVTGSSTAIIGGWTAAGASNFQGNIAHLKMYDRVLSEDERKTSYLRHSGNSVIKTGSSVLKVTPLGITSNDGTRDRIIVDDVGIFLQDSVGYAKLRLQGGAYSVADSANKLRFIMDVTASSMTSPNEAFTTNNRDTYSSFSDATRDRVKIDATDSRLVSPVGNQIVAVSNTSATYNSYEITAHSATTHDIFTTAQLTALATASVITVSGVLTLNIKATMTNPVIYELETGSTLVLNISDGVNYISTTTGNFFSGSGSLRLTGGVLLAVAGGTLFNYRSLNPYTTTQQIDGCQLYGWDLGTVDLCTMFIRRSAVINHTAPMKFKNIAALKIIDFGFARIGSGAIANSIFEIESGARNIGNTPEVLISDVTGRLLATDSFINVKPCIGDEITANITSSLVGIAGTLFNTTGSTGTFTAVADASIGATSITSVTDSSGVARFNFTTPTVNVNQDVVISGFTTNTAYNGTHKISSTDGTSWFEIYYIAFGSNETGSFLSNSVTLTDTGTSLSDGDCIGLDTDLSTAYDIGSHVYNKQTNSVQVNATWSATATGTWSEKSLTEDSPLIEVSNSGQSEASHNTLFAYVNTNATTTTFSLANTWYPAELGTVVSGLSTSRFKYVGNNTFKITTLAPLMGVFEANLSVVKSGTSKEYEFRINLTSGTGSFDSVIKEHTISSGISSFPVKASGFLQPGDEFQIEARVASTSQSEMTISGFNGEFR